jgi:hypothetical protein
MVELPMNVLSIVFLFLGVVFLTLAFAFGIIGGGRGEVRVGDVYVHGNPGNSNDPMEEARPFASLDIVQKIEGDKALVKKLYISADGKTAQGEHWERLEIVGRFDKKVKSGLKND